MSLNFWRRPSLRLVCSLLGFLVITACAPQAGLGSYQTAVLADFPTSLGQATILPLADEELEVRVPGAGGFIIYGVDVVDIQVFPLAPKADGEVILIGTSYTGCNRDYFAITYGAWEPDFYRLGDCERPMTIGFGQGSESAIALIQDRQGRLRYGVDQRQMARLDPAIRTTGTPPIPSARPGAGERLSPSRSPAPSVVTSPGTSHRAAGHTPGQSAPRATRPMPSTEFKLPPVGTMDID